jgi:probable phosphoglycerate mutase
MDQDMPHRISSPSKAAPGPRYSLVWKLLWWPTGGPGSGTPALANPSGATAEQTGKASGGGGAAVASLGGQDWGSASGLARPEWGPPQRIGSAAAGAGGRRLPFPL